MKKITKISIPEPCSKKWNEMQDAGRDKFCDTCSKKVVNFKDLSPEEVLEKLAATKTRVCGRFGKQQLAEINTSIRSTKPRPPLQKAVQFGLGIFLAANIGCVSTQHAKTPAKPDFTQHQAAPAQYKILKELPADPSQGYFTIKGQTVDQTGAPIAIADIYVREKNKKNSAIGLQSDFDGYFELRVPKNTEFENHLSIELLGYTHAKIELDSILNKEIQIILEESAALLGDVMIIGETQMED